MASLDRSLERPLDRRRPITKEILIVFEFDYLATLFIPLNLDGLKRLLNFHGHQVFGPEVLLWGRHDAWDVLPLAFRLRSNFIEVFHNVVI